VSVAEGEERREPEDRPEPPAPDASAPPAPAPPDRATLVLLAGAAALLVFLFWPILSVRWRYYDEQPRYSHCPLLPVVSAIWVYDRWDMLRALPRSVSRGGIVTVVVSVLAFVYGRMVSMNFLQHLALLTTIAGAVWALCGPRVLRACAFPLSYLALTMPLPKTWDERITQPLQTIATRTSEGVFHAFGWVVVRQGNVLQLPGLKLLVEDACSGIHSLYALVCLGIAWVAFVDRPRWTQAVLVLSTVPVAIVANTLRVIGSGILAYKVDPKYAEGTSHTVTGLVVFVTGLLLFLLVDWCLRPDPRADARRG
jgi:exosortase